MGNFVNHVTPVKRLTMENKHGMHLVDQHAKFSNSESMQILKTLGLHLSNIFTWNAHQRGYKICANTLLYISMPTLKVSNPILPLYHE